MNFFRSQTNRSDRAKESSGGRVVVRKGERGKSSPETFVVRDRERGVSFPERFERLRADSSPERTIERERERGVSFPEASKREHERRETLAERFERLRRASSPERTIWKEREPVRTLRESSPERIVGRERDRVRESSPERFVEKERPRVGERAEWSQRSKAIQYADQEGFDQADWHRAERARGSSFRFGREKRIFSPPIPTLKPLASYSYEPLDRSVDSIRLLKLKPSRENQQTIECQLVHATFASKPIYEALSYTWGSGNLSEVISIDGQEVQIGSNLASALHKLRSQTRQRVLWVDAVCINQKDIEERNHQVSLMAFIYSRAKAVLVWLGRVVSLERRNGKLEFTDVEAPEMIWNQLCHLDYWNRVWIVQEIGLAKEINFCYDLGNECRVQSWRAFMEELNMLVHDSKASRILKLYNQREGRHGDTNRLEMLLANFADSQCAEPRDKIYGFLGLAHDCQDDRIMVNYSKSLFELYRDVIALQHSGKPIADPLPPEADRKLRLVAFSELVQQLFNGKVEAEIKRLEIMSNISSVSIPPWTARGLVEGAIVHFGPSYGDAISSFQKIKKWKASFERRYQTSKDLRVLREMDEAYSLTLLEMDEMDISRISSIYSYEGKRIKGAWVNDIWPSAPGSVKTVKSRYAQWQTERMKDSKYSPASLAPESENTDTEIRKGPRRFLGSNHTMGLVPCEAEEGDLICRFWGCNTAAVIRWIPGADYFRLVGRADVATGWQKTQRQPVTINLTDSFEGGGVIDLCVPIEALQKLTF